MNCKPSYAHEKLAVTIHSLATGPGDIRKRLINAYLIFHTLGKEDFPKELQSDWDWVMKELKKFGPIRRDDGSVFRGSVENTCNKIKNKTGVKIAKKLLDMYLYLEHN